VREEAHPDLRRGASGTRRGEGEGTRPQGRMRRRSEVRCTRSRSVRASARMGPPSRSAMGPVKSSLEARDAPRAGCRLREPLGRDAREDLGSVSRPVCSADRAPGVARVVVAAQRCLLRAAPYGCCPASQVPPGRASSNKGTPPPPSAQRAARRAGTRLCCRCQQGFSATRTRCSPNSVIAPWHGKGKRAARLSTELFAGK